MKENMNAYDIEKPRDEENFDKVKAAVLQALVNENIIGKDIATEWCETHTILITKRNWFYTLVDKFVEPIPIESSYHIKVVKIIF
jgi:hypothetical protein